MSTTEQPAELDRVAFPDTPAGQQMRWQLAFLRTPAEDISFTEHDLHFHPDLLVTWPEVGDERARREVWRNRFEQMGAINVVEVTSQSPHAIEAVLETNKGKLWKVSIDVEDVPPHRIVKYVWDRVVVGVDVDVVSSRDLSDAQRAFIGDVFAATYRDGDLAYLDAQPSAMDCLCMATVGGEPAGFVFFAGREADLPRLGVTYLTYGGLSCVKPSFQRMGVWDAMRMDPRIFPLLQPMTNPTRNMSVGRMAHPGSFRGFKGLAGLVPEIGRPLTAWQQEVGAAVADVLGFEGFDRETFVCRGHGNPIGEPVVEVEASAEEWTRFGHVDRTRGDTLMAIGFWPTAPDAWEEA